MHLIRGHKEWGTKRKRRLFNGAWNPERRKLRVTREFGTLPQPTNLGTEGKGAREALVVAGVMLTAIYKFFRGLTMGQG
eukprot:CAMPEP_0184696526 /NCGR_PEP_ID=MMETSP0313-20130426/3780_1 /TAXON_ID=2792 /ORGANISM="Porphyridium aerugineum, Strain SAG 1380-2" /LENGTH=78 /DNA_ID=CAMNT_0027155157 /DNA_START=133 /DNA_END=369 /DNA_ORIENTATION=-